MQTVIITQNHNVQQICKYFLKPIQVVQNGNISETIVYAKGILLTVKIKTMFIRIFKTIHEQQFGLGTLWPIG